MTTHHADKHVVTAPQVAVLRWIANGRPDGVFEGYAHRQSARALENRGLVRIWGHGPSWRAEVTDKGVAAIEALASVPADGGESDIAALDPSPVDRLLERVIAAGGTLDVGEEFAREEIAAIERAALKSALRPHGRRLFLEAIGGWYSRKHEARLVSFFEDTVDALPVPVPEHVGALHPVARRFRDDKLIPVSKDHVARATRPIHALATEAERRGFVVTHPSEHTEHRYGQSQSLSGSIALTSSSSRVVFELRELPPNKGAARPRIWDASWRGFEEEPRIISNRQFVSTGVLQLADPGPAHSGTARYRDSRRATLESLLPDVFRELELQQLYAEERAVEAKRAADARRIEKLERLERAWTQFREDALASALDEQVAAWQRAALLRRYADALGAADSSSEAREWTEWIRYRADALDPARQLVQRPAPPVPSNEQLAPYLGLASGWAISTWLES